MSDRTATAEERRSHQQSMAANRQAGYHASSTPLLPNLVNQNGTPSSFNTTSNSSSNPSLAELEHQQNLARMQINLNQGGFSSVPAFVPVQHDRVTSPNIDRAVTNNELTAMQLGRGASPPLIPAGAIPLNAVTAAAAAAAPADSLAQNGNDYDFDENINQFGGEMDYAATTYPFKERVMHFLRGERIKASNKPVVEIALLIEYGAYVGSLGTMHNTTKFQHMRSPYLTLLDSFDECHFESLHVRQSFKERIYRAQLGIEGSRLWEKFTTFRSECRTLTTKFPTNLSSMPSGNQLNDVLRSLFAKSTGKSM